MFDRISAGVRQREWLASAPFPTFCGIQETGPLYKWVANVRGSSETAMTRMEFWRTGQCGQSTVPDPRNQVAGGKR